MKEALENLEQYAVEVIYDRKQGLGASLLRSVLLGLSGVWGAAVATRHFFYRKRILREHNLGCLVISIGNLTVGGTGKTPVVEMLARALTKGGRRVAILSRGYKSEKPPLIERVRNRLSGRSLVLPPRVVTDGKSLLLDSATSGDEPYMLAANLRKVLVLVDKDRVKSGTYAIRKHGVDTLLLDDGLQYLRLKHRLDIVLVDRTAPFGTGFLLPRGTLREPAKNLRRAHYIFITKCGGESNEELIGRLREHNQTAEIIECMHQPRYLQNVFTGERHPLDLLEGKYIGAMSGIASPESFVGGLRKLGAHVESQRHFTDHHRYLEKEVLAFINHCVDRDLSMIVTTEKDAVRLPKIARLDLPIYFLRVEIEILSGHESWEECVERICSQQALAAADRLRALS